MWLAILKRVPDGLRRSLAKLREALSELGHRVCGNTIRRLLIRHKIRPKSNRKRLNTTSHPLRDTQFQVIQREAELAVDVIRLWCQTGIHITDAEIDSLNLERHTICPKWNYAISPRQTGTCF